MEASQHSLLAACFTLHSINARLAIVPQRGAGLWKDLKLKIVGNSRPTMLLKYVYKGKGVQILKLHDLKANRA
jgi:hypothetical protein